MTGSYSTVWWVRVSSDCQDSSSKVVQLEPHKLASPPEFAAHEMIQKLTVNSSLTDAGDDDAAAPDPPLGARSSTT